MAAPAVLVNPLGNDQLLQFYITKNLELGLANWPTNSDGVSAQSTTSEVGLEGPLLKDSSLAGVINQKQIKVFGLIQKTTKDDKCNSQTSVSVAQVSPAMSSVTDWEDSSKYGNHLAIAKNSSGDAWLFYIGIVDDDPTIQMVAISEVSTASQPDNDDTPDLKSYLAAYYSDSCKYIIYQLKNGHIRELAVTDDGSNDNALVDKATSKKLTPLAACNANNGVYLYFLNTDNTIYRIFKSNSTWGDAKVVGGKSSKTTDGSSPLAAVSDAETDSTKKSNSLFYIAKGSTAYTRYIDSW